MLLSVANLVLLGHCLHHRMIICQDKSVQNVTYHHIYQIGGMAMLWAQLAGLLIDNIFVRVPTSLQQAPICGKAAQH